MSKIGGRKSGRKRSPCGREVAGTVSIRRKSNQAAFKKESFHK